MLSYEARRAAAAGLLAAGLGTGCYHYVPAEAQGLRPGTEIQAALSAAPPASAGPLSNPVEGTLVRLTPDTAFMHVAASDFTSARSIYREISLPRSVIESIQQRKLDVARTALVAGVSVLIAALVVNMEFGKAGGNTATDHPNPGK